jgi:hypothetical protein
MADKKQVKFGGVVKVKIKKGKRRIAAKKPEDDRRYGPPPLGEEKETPGKAYITLHDMTQVFRQRNYRERSSSLALTGAAYFGNINPDALDNFRWSEMFYEPRGIGFINDQIAWSNVISQSLLRGVSNTGNPPLPANADDPPTSDIEIFDEVDVYALDETYTEIDYRKNDFCWPLAKTALASGVTIRVGGRTAVVGGAGWEAKPQKAENKTAEVYDLSVMPVPVGVNAWARGARDYYSKPGAFRPLLPPGNQSVKIEAAGHFYEPFDTADTANYKVTAEPLFSAPEVSGRFPVRAKQFRVFLAPQMWKFAYDTPAFDTYEFARTLPPQKWYRYRNIAVRGILDTDSENRDRYAVDTTGESPFTTGTGTYLYQDKLDFLTLPITATDFPHLESSTDQVALLAYSQLGWAMFRILTETATPIPEDATPISGNVVVTNTQTLAERLVGAIKVSDDKKYYIWRKTETERDLVTLYAGKVSPIAFAFEAPIVTYFNELTVPPQVEQFFPFIDFA